MDSKFRIFKFEASNSLRVWTLVNVNLDLHFDSISESHFVRLFVQYVEANFFAKLFAASIVYFGAADNRQFDVGQRGFHSVE